MVFYRKYRDFSGWVLGERSDPSDPDAGNYADEGGWKIHAKIPSPDLSFDNGILVKCPCDLADPQHDYLPIEERSDWRIKYEWVENDVAQEKWVPRTQLGIGKDFPIIILAFLDF